MLRALCTRGGSREIVPGASETIDRGASVDMHMPAKELSLPYRIIPAPTNPGSLNQRRLGAPIVLTRPLLASAEFSPTGGPARIEVLGG